MLKRYWKLIAVFTAVLLRIVPAHGSIVSHVGHDWQLGQPQAPAPQPTPPPAPQPQPTPPPARVR